MRDALGSDPVWFPARASLGLALIPGDADPSGLIALIAAAPDVLARAELGRGLTASVGDPRRPWALDDVLALDAAIGDPLVQVGLIVGAGERWDWPAVLRVRLGELRADPLTRASARSARLP